VVGCEKKRNYPSDAFIFFSFSLNMIQRYGLQTRPLRHFLWTSLKRYSSTSTIQDAITAEYSKRGKQSQEKGTAYEEQTVNALAKFQICVEACGKSSDRGVDFRGQWHLSARPWVDAELRVPIVGQCKRYNRVLGPAPIRELAGVSLRDHAIGILVSASGFSAQAMREWRITKAPIILVDLPPHAEHCHMFMWNDEAAKRLDGLVAGRSVTSKTTPAQVVLYYHGVSILNTT
jgi:hypothetical protein